MAGMTTRKQTAPEPSRCTSNANSAVAGTINDGREPASFVIRRNKGSSRPASVITPKNRMAKTNMPATGAISEMPATMNLAVCRPKPAASAPATGTRISAAMGERRLSRIAANKPQIINMPTVTSMAQRQVKLTASVMSPLPL